MRLIDYLRGERFVLVSDLPPEKVASRLDAELPPLWVRLPIGVAGWVAFGRFSLRFYRSIGIRREFLPILTGRIRPHGDGSRITLHYRAPRYLLILLGLWAGLVLGFILKGPGQASDLFQAVLFIGSAIALTVTIGIATLGDEAAENLPRMLAIVEAAADVRD